MSLPRLLLPIALPLILLGGSPLLKGQDASQGNIAEDSLLLVPIGFGYAFQVPDGDLGERFGPNSNIGLRTGVKMPNNLQFEIEGGFIFGNNVKHSQDLLAELKTSDGTILTANGNNATIKYHERGFHVNLMAGKVFSAFDYNPSSGFLLKAGVGFLQHNINIDVEENNVPQLEGDRKDYYDRRASGFSLHEFIGYQHFANNRVANFYIGLEFIQGFTKDRRSYNADDQSDRIENRMDLLHGIRAGVMLPLYDEETEETFYY